MRLSVITPTVARPSLRETLASVAGQLLPGDEHLVIGDGPRPVARQMCAAFGASYHDGPATQSYGTAQRDFAIGIAAGDWLLFCDDDDLLAPGALATVRAAIDEQPSTPLVFRMRTYHAGILWRWQVVAHGNVGTPMIVTPRYDDLPAWHDGEDAYTADFRFIKRVTDAHGVAWRENVICHVR